MNKIKVGQEVLCFEDEQRTQFVGIGIVEIVGDNPNEAWCVNRPNEPKMDYGYYVIPTFSGDTKIPFGDYCGIKLESVPASELLKFYYIAKDRPNKKPYENMFQLVKYIEDRLEQINNEFNKRTKE